MTVQPTAYAIVFSCNDCEPGTLCREGSQLSGDRAYSGSSLSRTALVTMIMRAESLTGSCQYAAYETEQRLWLTDDVLLTCSLLRTCTNFPRGLACQASPVQRRPEALHTYLWPARSYVRCCVESRTQFSSSF
jgi:hypothetical protein